MNAPFTSSVSLRHKRAQENANRFLAPYVCFFDTSGFYRVERFDKHSTIHNDENSTVFYPLGWKGERL